MKGVGIVFAKEVRDNLRDRRTVLSALGMAVVSPALFMWLMSFVLETTLSDAEKPITLPVIGAERAPNLVGFLQQNNIDVDEGPADPVAAVTDRAHGVVLVIPETYGEQFTSSTPANLQLVFDSSRTKDSERDFRRVRDVLRNYGSTIAALRLTARGVSPEVIRPLVIDATDVASPSARAVSLLGVIPYFVIFSVFMGGFYLAIDTTAGEREQGSLEPLLAQPVPRAALALGKLLATAVFSAATLALVLIAFSFAIGLVPLNKIGMSIEFGMDKVGLLFVSMLPLALLAAAFMMVVASFTKSFKEAQTYLTLVILVPTMPLLIVAFLSPAATPMTMAVPSLGQALMINEVIKGEVMPLTLSLISVASTLALAIVLSLVAVRLYKREGMLG